MTNAFSMRRLAAGDAACVHRLNDLFAEAFEESESYQSFRPTDQYLERLLQKPGIFALVAEVGGDIIGGLVAYQLDKFEQERSEIYIYDLAVAESHRRQGIATALISTLQQLAAEIGAWVIYVQADYGDEPAIALYSKLGRREDVMHFDIASKSG